MKIYTLDFDCNQPTAQQVNVPTNTDYKVGIKIRRNGELQSLSPDSVKLYTGETITVEPTDFNADKELATSLDAMVVALLPASISADLGGKTINTVVPEVSYDNGATWGEVHITTEFDHYFFVMDKSQGNYYYARLGLKNPKSKWEYLDGTKTGVVSTADTITMPANPQAFLNSNSGQWSITQFPCVFRLVIKYGGYSYPVYIEPDAEKTNGYVTFTLSSNDNASYTSEKLDIEKGYDFDDTISYSAGPAQSGDRAIFLSSEYSAEQVGLAGLELKIDDIKWGYNTAGATQLTVADISEWNEAKTYIGSQWHFFKWPNGNAALIFQSNNPTAFGWFSEDGTQAAWKEKVTIDPRWILSFGGNGTGNRTTVGKYWVVAYKFKIGTPWSAKFNLNTNVFKSQQGDIVDGVESASTAKLVGKFADGTDFDYNLVIV